MFKVFHILGILTDHIATSQLATIRSQVACVYMIQKNTKKNETYLEIGSKCATLHNIHPQSIFPIFLITYLIQVFTC